MRLASLLVLVACSQPIRTAPRPDASELSPALRQFDWWLGDWQLDNLESYKGSARTAETTADTSEHWIAAGGAMYGIGLHPGGFEVMIVDDGEGPGPPDGVLRFVAMPGGKRAVEFRARALKRGETGGVFTADHDFPQTIAYHPAGDRLAADLDGNEAGAPYRELYRFSRTTGARAQVLEDADLAFAADVAARGVDGWVAAFDPQGGMMRRGQRVEGAEAIAEAMRETLSAGKLAWAPIASRARGDLGFTVGKATYTGATPATGWKSTYVTIWRRQPDKSWKVLFDTGRLVNE